MESNPIATTPSKAAGEECAVSELSYASLITLSGGGIRTRVFFTKK
jgi:hypothetical protein